MYETEEALDGVIAVSEGRLQGGIDGKRPPQVAAALDDQRLSLNQLVEDVAALTDRLRPIVREEVEEVDRAEKAAASYVPLAEAIYSHTVTIREIQGRVVRLLATLEL